MPRRKRWLMAVLLALWATSPARAQEVRQPPPPTRSVFDVLRSDPLLRDVDFEHIEDEGPVALAIEVPVPADKEHVSALSGALGEFARALIDLWQSDYAGPTGLR